MRKSVIFTLFLMVFSVASGQVLFRYPKGQKPYNGDFYKDFHQVLKDNHIKPCENKNEIYELNILVNEDASVNFINNTDEQSIQESKCTIEVIKQVLPKMKAWIPAQVDGKNAKAYVKRIIYLDDLFNYKEGYKETDYGTQSTLIQPKELIKFMNKIKDRLYRKMKKNNKMKDVKVELAFHMNKIGKIEGVTMVKSSGNEEIDKEFIEVIMSMKDKQWEPLKYRGIPIKSEYVWPISIE